MDDLTDLWLINTRNLNAADLDMLLDNLATMEASDTEGILYMTKADFDALDIAGDGLLSAWDAEAGHHIAIVVPEPTAFIAAMLGLIGVMLFQRRTCPLSQVNNKF